MAIHRLISYFIVSLFLFSYGLINAEASNDPDVIIPDKVSINCPCLKTTLAKISKKARTNDETEAKDWEKEVARIDKAVKSGINIIKDKNGKEILIKDENGKEIPKDSITANDLIIFYYHRYFMDFLKRFSKEDKTISIYNLKILHDNTIKRVCQRLNDLDYQFCKELKSEYKISEILKNIGETPSSENETSNNLFEFIANKAQLRGIGSGDKDIYNFSEEDKTSKAEINLSRDYNDNTNTWSLKASLWLPIEGAELINYLNNKPKSEGQPSVGEAKTETESAQNRQKIFKPGWVMLPGVSWDKKADDKSPSKEIDRLNFYLGAQVPYLGRDHGLAFDQYFKVFGVWATDSEFNSSVPAIQAMWEPVYFPLAMGAAHALFDEKIRLRIRPYLYSEYGVPTGAGDSTQLEGSPAFLRFGPALQITLWPFEYLGASPSLKRLTLVGEYKYRWGIMGDPGSTDYFEAGIDYPLENFRDVSIVLKYTSGKNDITADKVDQLVLGLGLRF